LEEIKLLQKQRERKSGIPATLTLHQSSQPGVSTAKPIDKNDGGGGDGGDKDDLVLQDTFAQETAVMDEDPNMYVFLLRLLKFQFFLNFLLMVNIDI
jgi:hypothetical protein